MIPLNHCYFTGKEGEYIRRLQKKRQDLPLTLLFNIKFNRIYKNIYNNLNSYKFIKVYAVLKNKTKESHSTT